MAKPPPFPSITPPNKGEEIKALFLQALAERLERVERAIGANDPVAAVLSALPSEQFIQCRIVGRRFAGDPIPAGVATADYPSLFTYDIVGVRRPSISRTNVVPVYCRPVALDESKVYPAIHGGIVYLVRSPRPSGSGFIGELMMWPAMETPARRRCGGGISGLGLRGATSSKKPPDKIVEPDPPPPPPTPAQRYGFGQLGTGNETAEFTKGGDGVLGGDLGGGPTGDTPGGPGL